jgi:hypothetical protein
MSLPGRLTALERAITPAEGPPVTLWLDYWRDDGAMLDGRSFARLEGESSAQLAQRAITTLQGVYSGRRLVVFSWSAP